MPGRSASCIRSRSACARATGRVRDAYLDRQPYFQTHAAVPGLRDCDPLDRHLPLPDGRGRGGLRVAAKDQSGDRRRGRGIHRLRVRRRRDRAVRRQPAQRPRRRQPAPHDGRDVARKARLACCASTATARLWWKPHHEPEVEHRYDRGPEDSFGGGACQRTPGACRFVISSTKAPLENSGRDYLAEPQACRKRSTARTKKGRRIDLAMMRTRAASTEVQERSAMTSTRPSVCHCTAQVRCLRFRLARRRHPHPCRRHAAAHQGRAADQDQRLCHPPRPFVPARAPR